jgi:hypothetical protein
MQAEKPRLKVLIRWLYGALLSPVCLLDPGLVSTAPALPAMSLRRTSRGDRAIGVDRLNTIFQGIGFERQLPRWAWFSENTRGWLRSLNQSLAEGRPLEESCL